MPPPQAAMWTHLTSHTQNPVPAQPESQLTPATARLWSLATPFPYCLRQDLDCSLCLTLHSAHQETKRSASECHFSTAPLSALNQFHRLLSSLLASLPACAPGPGRPGKLTRAPCLGFISGSLFSSRTVAPCCGWFPGHLTILGSLCGFFHELD